MNQYSTKLCALALASLLAMPASMAAPLAKKANNGATQASAKVAAMMPAPAKAPAKGDVAAQSEASLLLAPFKKKSGRAACGLRKAVETTRVPLAPSKRAPKRSNIPADMVVNGCLLWTTPAIEYPAMYRLDLADGTADPATDMLKAGVNAVYGGAQVGGIYYAVNGIDNDEGPVSTTIDAYDCETWDLLSSTPVSVGLRAYDVAYDPTTGRVYGAFFNDEGTKLTFGYADYASGERTVIKTLSNANWMGVACSPAGEIYMITSSGQLYSVDKETGDTTPIGNTDNITTQYYTSAFIHPDNGYLYFGQNDNYSSILYEYDLTTGVATYVVEFDDGDEYTGMYVPYTFTTVGIPDKVTDLTADFAGGSLQGMVDFRMPETNADGASATGELSYVVKANGVEVAYGTASYGEQVQESVTVAASGTYTFKVSVSNDNGESIPVVTTLYVGNDTPVAPEASVELVNGQAKVTWNPVTEGVHGGYIDGAAVTYDVVRKPQDVTVASALSATEYTDAEAQGLVQYGVYATFDGKRSEVGATDKVQVGTLIPPYFEDFSSATIDDFTVIDANDDGKAWEITTGQVARMKWNTSMAMDDWLILPAIHLEAGYMYDVVFQTYANGYDERIEVKYGSAPTVEAMTNTIVEPTVVPKTVKNTNPMTLSGRIVAQDGGDVYIGFHGISDADMYYLYVDNIQVGEGTSLAAPGRVTDLQAVPAEDGTLKATVSFTAPTIDMTGATLTDISKVEIERDNQLIATLTDVAPGAACSYTDEEGVTNGDHTYTVTCANVCGYGLTATVDVFVGLGYPAAVEECHVVENTPGNVTVTWSPVTTDESGKTFPDGVTYDLYTLEGYYRYPVAKGLTSTTYTYDAVEEGEQEFMQWIVFAMNGTDEGDGQVSEFIPVGTPYTAPYCESFSSQALGSAMAVSTNCNVALCGDETYNDVASSDGDDGFVIIKGQSIGHWGKLITGKIDVPANGLLSFYTMPLADDDVNQFDIYVISDGEETLLATTYANTVANAFEWGRIAVPVGAYAGRTVQFAVMGTIKAYAMMLIDNICVVSACDKDLEIKHFQAPSKVKPGVEFAVGMTVVNNGALAADSYTVELWLNGDRKVAEVAGEPIASNERMDVTFHHTLNSLNEADNFFSARVVYPGDEVADNNATGDVEFTLIQHPHPTVSDLSGVKNDDGSYTLSWTAPDLSDYTGEDVFETFESAESFAKEYDDWTFVDLDNERIGGFENMTLPGLTFGSDMSVFFIFDKAAVEANYTFDGHSGTKYLAALFNSNDSQLDDWAISPELNGQAQTISFYARSYSDSYPETIEVYYSTGSLAPADFVKISRHVALPSNFQLIEADLPQGAKHFAVRSCATGSFMLILDDFTFTKASAASLLTLQGYNVYRNGDKMHDDLHAATEFTDTEMPEGIHNYHVTAMYDKGESTPVLHTASSGIDGASAGAAVSVRATKGAIHISSPVASTVKVYSADGRCIALQANATKATIPVAAGVYLVSVDGRIFKVAAH